MDRKLFDEKRKEKDKAYRSRPEVKERIKKYQKEYRSRPKLKKKNDNGEKNTIQDQNQKNSEKNEIENIVKPTKKKLKNVYKNMGKNTIQDQILKKDKMHIIDNDIKKINKKRIPKFNEESFQAETSFLNLSNLVLYSNLFFSNSSGVPTIFSYCICSSKKSLINGVINCVICF